MTLEQLKAYAYDCMANIEKWKAELNEANRLIGEKMKEPQVEKEAVELPAEPQEGEKEN